MCWKWQDGEYYGEELDRKYRASIVAQLVKSPPAMLETWVRSLGWEDSLEKEMATQSSILSMERVASPGATVHGVPKSCTQLSYGSNCEIASVHFN